MGNHALLSASSSHRWLNCPPSARLGENYEDKGQRLRRRGNGRPQPVRTKLKTVLGIPSEAGTTRRWRTAPAVMPPMWWSCSRPQKQTCSDPVILIEQRVDFSRWVRDGFGTGDCVLIADGALNIVDYKHGKGVEVSADHNPQMMLYALGALEIFDALYDIDTVTMTIYQPQRKSNISV